jgi:hypothetical protein
VLKEAFVGGSKLELLAIKEESSCEFDGAPPTEVFQSVAVAGIVAGKPAGAPPIVAGR